MYANEAGKISNRSDRYGVDVGAGAQLAAREPEVAGELTRLDKTLAELSAVSEHLLGRLASVRRQTGGSAKESSETQPQPVMCELASTIRDRRRCVERIISNLSVAAAELEI